MNTNSIQTGINYIHKEGGGVLVFNVGRYLTGSIELKSNVAIQLKEGAVLVLLLFFWMVKIVLDVDLGGVKIKGMLPEHKG